jgi:hypothetical protein
MYTADRCSKGSEISVELLVLDFSRKEVCDAIAGIGSECGQVFGGDELMSVGLRVPVQLTRRDFASKVWCLRKYPLSGRVERINLKRCCDPYELYIYNQHCRNGWPEHAVLGSGWV